MPAATLKPVHGARRAMIRRCGPAAAAPSRMDQTLPTTVRRDIATYLAAVDDVLPGFLEGVYVVGSIPLGDYRPAISDVDLVAVSAWRPTKPQLDALASIHRPSHPSIDVLYVAGDDLGSDPRQLSPPYSLDGTFMPDGGFMANPVTWRQLQLAAVPVRGPRLAAGDVWFDADTLRRWNVANLDDYWARRLRDWRGIDPTEPAVRHKSGLQWLVLGVPRLHYTITTLGVTSKTGAGRYALGVVDDRWHPVVEVALALRSDRSTTLPMSVEALHAEAAEVSAWLIEDAHRPVERLP